MNGTWIGVALFEMKNALSSVSDASNSLSQAPLKHDAFAKINPVREDIALGGNTSLLAHEFTSFLTSSAFEIKPTT